VDGGGDGGGGDGGGGAGGGGDGALMESICTYGGSMRSTVTPVAAVSCDGFSDVTVLLVTLASVRLLAVMDTLTTTLACQARIEHSNPFSIALQLCTSDAPSPEQAVPTCFETGWDRVAPGRQ
jgi:hypothetical protein